MLDLAVIRNGIFVGGGAIATQFCFTYTLERITAMPRGLHARLCNAFLVIYFCYS